jgi:hypothetical protein
MAMRRTKGVSDRQPGGHALAAVVAVLLALAVAGCENLVVRGSGGSDTGVNNAEFGFRF